MAIKHTFKGKTVSEPGTYSDIKSEVKNMPIELSYGNILIIDTGSGAEWGGGSGIDGTLSKGAESIKRFSDIRSMQKSMRGGWWWLLALPLFRPSKDISIDGVSRVSFIKAAKTTPAELTMNFKKGHFTIQCKNEGLVGNGYEYEKLASSIVKITEAGDPDDMIEISIKIDEDNSKYLATYTVGIDEDKFDIASGLTNEINSGFEDHKFKAILKGDSFFIVAPEGTGSEGNSYTVTINKTGDIEATTSVFEGGLSTNLLTQGYAAIMKVGKNSNEDDPDKFEIEFIAGTYKGSDGEDSFDQISQENTKPEKLVTSVEFNNLNDLINWMNKNVEFNEHFKLKDYEVIGAGNVTEEDLLANSGNILATGGTEEYGSEYLEQVLDNVTTEDYTFVLSDQYGVDPLTGAYSTDNLKILYHLQEEAKGDKFMVVGAGDDRDEFAESISIATLYDTAKVILVHGGVEYTTKLRASMKKYPSLYKAALVLGRIAGLPPQVPATFKDLNIDKDTHEMTEKERVLALEKGLLHTKYDEEFGAFIINQAINTMQKNSQFFETNDGQSYEISIMRIAAQLNKEIVYNAKMELLSGNDGVNRNILTPEDVSQWLNKFLRSKTANTTTDNVILSYQDIAVERVSDAYFVTYKFVANTPINKLFFTGTII